MTYQRKGLDTSDIQGAKASSKIKPYNKGQNFERDVNPANFVINNPLQYNLIAPHLGRNEQAYASDDRKAGTSGSNKQRLSQAGLRVMGPPAGVKIVAPEGQGSIG